MSQPTQVMQALQVANEVRLTNARTCRRLTELSRDEARMEVARLLVEDETAAFESLKVERLLTRIRRLGPTTAYCLLRQVGVQIVGKRVRDLTPRQRVALAKLLSSPDGVTYSTKDAA